MRKFISIFALLFLFVTTGAYGQVTDESKEELLSLHAVTKYCRYNNGKIIPQGGSSLSVSFTGIAGGWPGGGSQAAPDSVPLANLFNKFDSVIPLPDYRREWFYPPGELDAGKKMVADMWRNNRQGAATAKYGKWSDGYQTSRLEHTRTWVTANEPVPYERKRLLRVSTKMTVDGTPLQPQERIVTATIPAKDTHSSSLDLKPGSLWMNVFGVSLERPFTATYKEEVAVSLLPMEVVSRDKFLAGSIVIPGGWDSLQMEFIGPGEVSLGKYGDFFPGIGSPGATKIYPKVEDILAETDETGQSPDQKVWFARNPSDPRKIDFYTCFNSIGETRIKLYLNGASEPMGEITHLLKPDAGMAEWIAYADAWVKGTSFPWAPEDPGPPLAMRMGAAGFSSMSSLSEELDNYTRAALIPIFLAVESVEGMRALVYGLLDGVKQGALDDWELLVAIGKGTAETIDWAVSKASFQFYMLIDNPRESAKLFVEIARAASEKFLFEPMRQAGEALKKTFSSWESVKNSAFRMWDHIYNTAGQISEQFYIGGGQIAGKISDSLVAWHNDFSDRMMKGAEKASFDGMPWEDDIFFAGADSASTAMNYATGYTIGYVCEQIVAGKGSAAIGKVLLRGAAMVVGKLATRTSFAVNSWLHKLKKKVQGGASAILFNQYLDEGFSRMGRMPSYPWVPPVILSESLDDSLKSLGPGRDSFNTKTLIDDLYDRPNIRKLTSIPAYRTLFAERIDQICRALGAAKTADGLKGFVVLYERSLWFDQAGAFTRDHFDDLIRVFDPESSAEAAARLNTALEKYAANAAGLDLDLVTYRYLTIQDAGKLIPAGLAEHPAVRTFRDRVEALWPEVGNTDPLRYEGVAAARYEWKTGKTLRRSNSSDTPEYVRVDYAEIPSAPSLIDVKGPILDNPGTFYDTATAASAGIARNRVEGLAVSAVKKLKQNAGLTPPIPTVVVLDLFNLSAAEKSIALQRLNAEAVAAGVDATKIIIIQ